MLEGYHKIIGRCTAGVRVKAYVLLNVHTNEHKVVDKDIVYKMALNKRIINCYAQEYAGKVVLKGTKGKIVDLPVYNMDGTPLVSKKKENKNTDWFIKSRIVYGKSTIGYIVSHTDIYGNTVNKKIDRDKLIGLAREGKIANARVQRLNDKFLLRGVSCELSQLPVVRV